VVVPRIIDETRGKPELRSLMLSITQFFGEIHEITMFIKEIDVCGDYPMAQRPMFSKRELKMTSLFLKNIFDLIPEKYPILLANAVHMLSFLHFFLVSCFIMYPYYSMFAIGVHVATYLERKYDWNVELSAG
jgi:hypothetical protein